MKWIEQVRTSGGMRFLMLAAVYAFGLSVSFGLAYLLRFDFDLPPSAIAVMWPQMAWIVPMKLGLLLIFRQFEGLLSYFSLPDLRRLMLAQVTASGTVVGVWFLTGGTAAPPRAVILTDFVIAFTVLAATRLGFRIIRERYLSPNSRPISTMRRVGIIGAGDVGANLARELTVRRGLGLQPVVFFDDDRAKWRSRVHDIPVAGPPEILLDNRLNLELEKVIIAMPSATAKRVGEVVKVVQRARLPFQTVPSMDQLATGKVKVSQLRSVQIQDLLGRDPVELKTDQISAILKDRVVLVTGAGGSIGGELCRQIVAFNPHRLLLLDQCEVQLFQIEQDLIQSGYGGVILPQVANILDEARIRWILTRFRPEIIFHAAAHKHVPMMESQPPEAFRNNTVGTMQLARLARECGSQRFVLISTDKAINPTSVMGATKRLAEIFLQAFQAEDESGKSTKLMAVRFGNVLGSSGSVVPIFQKQIAAGGPVRVTHPDVTRYFMTIPEAVGLVLQSAALGRGGEIFVLDMGQPVKIVDLARQMIELSGLRPEEDIEIEFSGLRPGEKLFEELSHVGEQFVETDHPKILRFVCQPPKLSAVLAQIESIASEIHKAEPNQFKLLLKRAVPEYEPYLT